jgi:ABC-type sulfate transport system substrate-binding protein
MPIRVLVTSATTADCSQTHSLIDGIDADYLLADSEYDSNAIFKHAQQKGIIPVVPPRKNPHTICQEYLFIPDCCPN